MVHSAPSMDGNSLPTHNEQQCFELEDYCKEFSGESCEASKRCATSSINCPVSYRIASLVAMSSVRLLWSRALKCKQPEKGKPPAAATPQKGVSYPAGRNLALMSRHSSGADMEGDG